MHDSEVTGVAPQFVREELARIETSAAFRQADRLRALLRHLVERALDGDAGALKEIALGIDVFRRPAATFDPRKDPIVRVEAGRLRNKLARYYADEGWNDLVEVSLPVGQYRPEFRRRARPTRPSLAIPSLVVLPVTNLTGDPAHDVFCDGLTDELIDTFARLPGLKVIARTTAFKLKGCAGDVRTIGRKVGAATVLEASVQQRGAAVKVIAQLVQASDGAHLWSRVFAADAAEFFALEESLARDIVEALQKQFSAHAAAHAWTTSRRALVRRSTADAAAREMHDQARALLRRIRPASQYRAIELFGEAARLDPGFALAHSGAGAAWTNLASIGAEPARRANSAAMAASLRALEIDGELHEALSVRAYVTYRDTLHAREAEMLYRGALRLNPGAPYLRLGYAWLLAYTHRFDAAREQFQLIRDIDPLDIGLRHNFGHFLLVAGDFDGARGELARALEIEPEDPASRIFLAEVALAQGRHDEALAESRRLAAVTADAFVARALLAMALHACNRADEADAAFAEVERRARADACAGVAMAITCATTARSSLAFAWLDRAAEVHDIHLVAVPTHPLLDVLHADPRWAAWLRRHGFDAGGGRVQADGCRAQRTVTTP